MSKQQCIILGVSSALSFSCLALTQASSELPFGAIKPDGWIKTQMRQDINSGFVGNLDKLVPDLIMQDDIYGEDRLTKLNASKNLGTRTTGDDWEVQFLWWNSETQSNWWDGYLRNVLLVGDKEQREKVDRYIANKLSTQDDDGYMGIYGTDLRYQHATENGELWAQSSLFRGMIAYYEASSEQKILEAVKSAVAVTMRAYPIDHSTPFKVKNAFAGVGHGLTFTDVLFTLYRLTKDETYLDYATFLLDDYNRHTQPEEDVLTRNLLDETYRFKGHGVHTYEHLRTLTIAAYHSHDKTYAKALEAYLERLENVVTASGGPIGDEWIGGRHAHHTETGYEYCSLQELLHSYTVLLNITGEAKWADKIEWLLFNAAQGARHPDGKSIAYCKSDNAYDALGYLDMDALTQPKEKRFKYSPAHQDVAVCCVPNAGRIYPYYVQSMWSQTGDGLVANLFGPSTMQTKIDETSIKVTQQTRYPFEHQIKFSVEVSSPRPFSIKIRKPSWSDEVSVDGVSVTNKDDYLVITKTWKNGSSFIVDFRTSPKISRNRDDSYSVSYGPILFASPISHQELVGKSHPVDGFQDLFYKSTLDSKPRLLIDKTSKFILNTSRFDEASPWDSAFRLRGKLYDVHSQQWVDADLQPMASTILRLVSFGSFSNEIVEHQAR